MTTFLSAYGVFLALSGAAEVQLDARLSAGVVLEIGAPGN